MVVAQIVRNDSMSRRTISISILSIVLLILVPIVVTVVHAAGNDGLSMTIWDSVNRRYVLAKLGPSFVINLSTGTIDVPVTVGPRGPIGPTGPVGPVGPT